MRFPAESMPTHQLRSSPQGTTLGATTQLVYRQGHTQKPLNMVSAQGHVCTVPPCPATSAHMSPLQSEVLMTI